jgi:ribosomal protein L7/L12
MKNRILREDAVGQYKFDRIYKIELVNKVREVTGLGLAEAKELVDLLEDHLEDLLEDLLENEKADASTKSQDQS